MKIRMRLSVILLFYLLLASCSDEGASSDKKDHVWKEQTDTINTAKQVEGMMLDSAAASRKAMDQQMQ